MDTYVADETTNEPVLQTQPVQIFELDSALQYKSIQTQQTDDYMQQRHFGRGVWTWDLNRDGRVDTGVTHQTEPVAVLVNHSESQNHWVELQLVGVTSARDAIGARITLHDQGFERAGWVVAGDGYLCSSERVVRFGLGKSNSPREFTITWPDGSEQALAALSVDARWLVVQGSAPYRLD
ncbi:hypothetical protein Rcae01_03395 [Novipirellula caenicola]|uniref:ASPIC/UnbV domain-containing protein n=1 Tax=Novipirellula caenicola TaxID=1536901 RepID=A0ABP9VVU1_9BACT